LSSFGEKGNLFLLIFWRKILTHFQGKGPRQRELDPLHILLLLNLLGENTKVMENERETGPVVDMI
jgi:hypothetical protein